MSFKGFFQHVPREARDLGRRADAARREGSRARRPALEGLEERLVLSTFLVDNAFDPKQGRLTGTLRGAIAEANLPGNEGSTVEITPSVTSSLIVLTAGELRIKSSMTIENASGHPITIKPDRPDTRVFEVTANPLATNVTLSGLGDSSKLTITGGSVGCGNGGGILVNNRANNLTLSYVDVTGNASPMARPPGERLIRSGNGGGVYSRGSVMLVHSAINSNQASGIGGGVDALKGVSLVASQVAGNSAGLGGGVVAAEGDVTLNNASSVSGNTVKAGMGGGIAVVKGSVSVLNQSQVDGNTADEMPGIMVTAGNVVVSGGSTVSGNKASGGSLAYAEGSGGGIAVASGNVDISGSQVDDNRSAGLLSGGIGVALGNVTLEGASQVVGNVSQGPGGGVAADFGGNVEVTGGSEVVGNTGSALGGGIANLAAKNGSVTISGGSRVAGNTVTNATTLRQTRQSLLQFRHDNPFRSLAVALGGEAHASTGAALRPLMAPAHETAALLKKAEAQVPASVGSLGAGGGIAVLSAPIAVNGGGEVTGNLSGSLADGGKPPALGIGGGLFDYSGEVVVTQAHVDDNSATGSGAGLWNGGTLTINGGTVAGNRITGAAPTGIANASSGGGLFNASGARATITGATVQGNQAAEGGGIANLGTLTITSTTVAGNTATTDGGGIFNTGKLNQTNVTFANNTPDNLNES